MYPAWFMYEIIAYDDRGVKRIVSIFALSKSVAKNKFENKYPYWVFDSFTK
jgi:hypothetical protein